MAEPVVLAPSLVLKQPAEGHGRGPDRCGQTDVVQAGALPGEGRTLPLQEPHEGSSLVCSQRRLGAAVLIRTRHDGRR